MNALLQRCYRLFWVTSKQSFFSRGWIWFAAVLVNVIWALTYASSEFLLQSFSPLEMQTVRFLLAWAVLWLVYPRLSRIPTLCDHLVLTCMGGVGVALYQFLESCAIERLHSTTTGVLMSLGPLFSVIVLALVRRAPLSPSFLAGGIVAAFASAVFCSDDILNLHFRLDGIIAAVCAMLCWCVYVAGNDFLTMKGIVPTVIVRGAFFWSVLLSLVMLAARCLIRTMTAGLPPADFMESVDMFVGRLSNFTCMGHFLLLGIVASSFCSILWCWIGAEVGFGRASILLYLSPILVVLMDVVFWGKDASAREWAGAFFAAVGVGFAMRAQNCESCRPRIFGRCSRRHEGSRR